MAGNGLQELMDFTREEVERTQREMREIALLVEQSRGEVDKLAQRNATINNHLRQLQQNFDTVPRNDIKNTYDAVLDAQQRLFTMRGQLEKLQSDQVSLDRYAKYLNTVLENLGNIAPGAMMKGAAASAPGAIGVSGGTDLIVRIIDAQEAERQRISKTMHDGPAQSLTNFVLQAEIVTRLFDSNPEQARIELQNLKTTATSTFQRVREFITELRPMMLDDLGLVPTVRRYVKAFEEKSGIQTTLTITGEERRFEPHREVLAFRGVQELLSNAREHSQGNQIRVTLDIDDLRVRITVEDNGKGFDVAAALVPEQKHIGLNTLKEKAELLGGQLQIDSTLGQGTRAALEIPVGSINALM
ncbi:MAG: sensor histidine kinase [Chloroflexi bacterium]|nr:sensor histidine kinase [Chloroflexota bacterium]